MKKNTKQTTSQSLISNDSKNIKKSKTGQVQKSKTPTRKKITSKKNELKVLQKEVVENCYLKKTMSEFNFTKNNFNQTELAKQNFTKNTPKSREAPLFKQLFK